MPWAEGLPPWLGKSNLDMANLMGEPRAPLATRVRPRRLEDFVGQEALTGAGKPLRRLLEQGELRASLIFWGPPGCGKTTLALLVASALDLPVVALSAVESGVKELRAAVAEAKERGGTHALFIDEIHRYSKTQQDALLPHVESGLFRLLGATTESPRSCLTPALLSRCEVFGLKALGRADLESLVERALHAEQGLGHLQVQLAPGALEALWKRSLGDARRALNLLESAASTAPSDSEGRPRLTPEWITEQMPDPVAAYTDADHYNLASAFIKSMRGSDPQAALYWLGRMVTGGEPVDFITRRLRIAACEDVGLADPQAIMHTESCCAAAEAVGYPEARYPLSQAALYLSMAPKSNSLQGYFEAETRARETSQLPVPSWLAVKGQYRSPHEEPHHFRRVSHVPKELEGATFYQPGELGYEIKLKTRLDSLWGS